MKSKQNFYIAIPSDSGTNKISSINVKSNVKLKKADIWFFESSLGANQNLIYFEPGESTNELDKNFEYDIRMCYWGDATAGKILSAGETYSGEYKIKIYNESLKTEIVGEFLLSLRVLKPTYLLIGALKWVI